MTGKIVNSMKALAPEVVAAGSELHHLILGPGADLEAEWVAAGLELPDLVGMREYRLARLRRQLDQMGYDGAILWDPMNIRYATDTTNMQVWAGHFPSRYCWVGADGSLILWDFFECEFLSGHSPNVSEVRSADAPTYFLAGPRYEEASRRWANEMLDDPATRRGQATNRGRQSQPARSRQAGAGVTLGSGQNRGAAWSTKGPDEIKAMRCPVHACETTMAEMGRVCPGMSERDLSMLHAGNIRRGGEWIETQILSSGPRTNPWMQEVSSRIIEDGDLVAYDTDLVGAYGMMCDISRTWLAGDGKPSAQQQNTYDLARHQIEHNLELLTPGRTFHELTHQSWMPPVEDYRHYCVNYHGVGQCDEFPEITFPHMWDKIGWDGVLEPGMVLTVEAYVGPRDGGEGVKLEEQVLVTENGPDRLSNAVFELV